MLDESMQHTGPMSRVLWRGAPILASFLFRHRYLFTQSRARCIELGAGVGLLGMAASRCGVSRVHLTDGNVSVLDIIRCNLERNGLFSNVY